MEESLEMMQVARVAVGHRPLEVIPDELVGVEFRRIPGEPVGTQTPMSTEELSDQRPLMVSAVVPQQGDLSAQVLEQLPEERDHLVRPDVLVQVEPGVEGKLLPLRRYGDGRDG